ncbi:MAG: Co2+/Mg2+ efflux protein ApaG [Myxococcota bacterium]
MGQTKASEATTEGIRITVTPRYVPERSQPGTGPYVFAYEVTIANVGVAAAKLLTRHWIITDGEGREEHVRGPGVVGEQPDLAPGEAFRYQSFCPLPTPEGGMHGTYRMVRPDGSAFDAVVAPFALSVPRLLN